MNHSTKSMKCLGWPAAGIRAFRWCALTFAAVLITAGAGHCLGQTQPDAPKPAPKPLPAKKPVAEPTDKVAHGYMVHQSIELGGHIASTQGSLPMWNTLVDEGTGMRVLGQSLELRTVDRTKTPFFDTLTTNSFGYGGDPNDVSYLNISKGRIYDFAGSFRRDRQYFDYNLLANSLNTNSAGLVPELDSPHLFNTVRRNTDTLLTLFPLSIVSVRGGFNHNISEGPSYSSVHEGADGWLFQNWNNLNNTFIGGVDVKVAKRTTVSYDQFYVHYNGNTSWELAGLNAILPGGTPVSYGLDPGSGKCPGVVGGVGMPHCNGYLAMSIVEPIRTNFPTEQLRFSTRSWSRVSMNARFLYSGGKSTVPRYSEVFNGLTTRTQERQEIDTGAGPGGQLGSTRRDNVNADYGAIVDLTRFLSVSDAFNFWDFRLPGSNNYNSTVWAGAAANAPTLLTPISTLTPVTANNTNQTYLNQKILQNTTLATVSITSRFKLSGGYRFKTREVADYGPDDLTFHENWLLLGAVAQPAQMFRLNVNYDQMASKSANAATQSNTFTRLAPDKSYHLKVRGTVKPSKFVSLAGAVNDYWARNDDVYVNHTEHNRDYSFAASVIPMDTLSFDFDVSHDDVLSQTDICYVSSLPLAGATNSGACNANISGDPTYLLGNGYYHAPSTFFSGSLNYAPTHYLRFYGGARVNDINGQAEMLNPNMVPGSLESNYISPFSEAEFKVARQWAWRGNWTRHDYAEKGAAGPTAPRNVHGDIVTLSVKYAF
jgi:hypothetical protein